MRDLERVRVVYGILREHIYTTVRVVVVRCLLEKLIMSLHVMCFQYVLFHVMCFQYVLFQTYLEANSDTHSFW